MKKNYFYYFANINHSGAHSNELSELDTQAECQKMLIAILMEIPEHKRSYKDYLLQFCFW